MQPKPKADDEGSMAQRVSNRGPVAESSGLGGGSEVKGSLVFHVA
jgi:hypothetical protein